MAAYTLEYQLQNGFIQNWLVAGPLVTPIADPKQFGGSVPQKLDLIRKMAGEGTGISETPADQDEFLSGSETFTWNYTRSREDHFVEAVAKCPTWSYLRTWAYVQLKSPQALPVMLVLTCSSPARVWLNGKMIFESEEFAAKSPLTFSFAADLKLENEIMVVLSDVSVREIASQIALQVTGLPSADISVVLPTRTKRGSRMKRLEKTLEFAYLEEVVNHKGAHFNLRWSDEVNDDELQFVYQVQDSRGRIYVDGSWGINKTEPLDVGHTYRLYERPFFVVLKANGREYFEENLRYERRLPIHVLDNAYSSVPYATFNARHREALEDAVKHESNLFAEAAKLQLERWSEFKPDQMLEAVRKVNHREVDSPLLLVGLLGMLARYGDLVAFPEALKAPVAECALNFSYDVDLPGSGGLGFDSESGRILMYTAEILAGQLFAEKTFASGKTGAQHCQHGERLAVDWMTKRGQFGFRDWNSNSAFELDLTALSHLTSLACENSVCELAAVLMDKMFFLMGVNSYKGSFGSTHGRTQADMLKSAQLEATSGIMRMMWGQGVFNHHIYGTVSLASSAYEFPSFFANIAVDAREELWSKEHHSAGAEGGLPALEVDTAAYRTPDYLLSSVQDYQPGQRGNCEHVWQATFGPDAFVFVNHPACMSEDPAHQPGFWLGNASLPRTAQWKDTLVSVFHLPEDDWMGYTHAFFPVCQFDEYFIKDGWAFARKENGYLALTASCGLQLIKHAPDGYRELRSYGHDNIWLCQMGRQAQDGSFMDFQKKVMKMKPRWKDLGTRFTSLRGEEIAFAWEGALTVNGQAQPLGGAKHIDNAFCRAERSESAMDISYGDYLLRLDFE